MLPYTQILFVHFVVDFCTHGHGKDTANFMRQTDRNKFTANQTNAKLSSKQQQNKLCCHKHEISRDVTWLTRCENRQCRTSTVVRPASDRPTSLARCRSRSPGKAAAHLAESYPARCSQSYPTCSAGSYPTHCAVSGPTDTQYGHSLVHRTMFHVLC